MSTPTSKSLRALEIAYKALVSGELEYRDGEIWRMSNFAPGKTKPRKLGNLSRSGYLQITLVGHHTCSIHRVVWRYFKGRIPLESEINHKNGVKTDNRIENLELVDRSGNMLHLARTKGMAWTKARRDGGKLSNAQIREIRLMADAGVMQRVIAEKFGVGQQLVSMIHRGLRFAHVA